MKKALTWWDLMWFGMGAVIGVGNFMLAGLGAPDDAGPAVVLSYIVSSASALLSVFCYNEFAVDIPVGSFAYLRVELGDFMAFIVAALQNPEGCTNIHYGNLKNWQWIPGIEFHEALTLLKRPTQIRQLESSGAGLLHSRALLSGFGLMILGAGLIRPRSLAFGADQFNLNTRSDVNWPIRLAIPTIFMLISRFLFFVGTNIYVKITHEDRTLQSVVRVLVVVVGGMHGILPSSVCSVHRQ